MAIHGYTTGATRTATATTTTAAAATAKDDGHARVEPGWTCCQFKSFMLQSAKTLTRSFSAVSYRHFATRYGACARCVRVFSTTEMHCGNPYGDHKRGNFRRMVRRVEGRLADARRYPAFKNCQWICAYCINRAIRERRNRRGDKRILKVSKDKIKTSLRFMGLKEEVVNKGLTQLMSKALVKLARIRSYTVGNQEDQVTVKDITENYTSEKNPYLPLTDKNSRITSEHNSWQENTFIEITDSLQLSIEKAVQKKHVEYKSDFLEVNSIIDNTDVDLNYKHNLCKIAIPKNNSIQKSSNNLNVRKFEKRHSLPTAVIPQRSCIKKSRANSCDLPNYMEKTESITFTLQKDNRSYTYGSMSQNTKSNFASYPEDFCNTSNINEDKTNEKVSSKNNSVHTKANSSINSNVNLNENNLKLNSCTDKDVPELEMNDYQNDFQTINRNKLENSFSDYLRSKVKRKNTDLIVCLDKDNPNKRLKVPDKFIEELQPNISNETNFIVQKTSESSLNVKKSLTMNYSEVLPKIHPSIRNISSIDNNNKNLKSDNVHTHIITRHLRDLDEDKSKSINKNNNYALANSKDRFNNTDSFNNNIDNSHVITKLPEASKNNILNFDHKIRTDYNFDIIDNTINKEKNIINESETFNSQTISSRRNSLKTSTKLDKLKKKFRLLFEDSDTSEIEEQSESISFETDANIAIQEHINSKQTVEASLTPNTFHESNTLSEGSKLSKQESLNVNKNENSFNDSVIEKSCELSKSKRILELELCKDKEIEKISKEYVSTTKEIEDNHSNLVSKNNCIQLNQSANNVTYPLSIKDKVVKESIINFDLNNIKKRQDKETIEESIMQEERKNYTKESSKNFTRDESCEKKIAKENYIQKQHQQVCNSIDLPVKEITKDQVLPDSTQLDENLEGGDFDFLASIHNTKHGSENSDDDYDMDSDADIEYSNGNTDCFKQIENVRKTEPVMDISDVKSKNAETSNSQELYIQKDVHCLEKLPSFYNECIENVVNNEERRDSDDITILECILSNNSTKINKVKSEKYFGPEIINSELCNEALINSTNVASNNEQEVKITQSDNVAETEKTKEFNKCFDLQDYIISLCEASTDPVNNESSTLPKENTIETLSTEDCDNQCSLLTTESSVQKNIESSTVIHSKNISTSSAIANGNCSRINNELNSDHFQKSYDTNKSEIVNYKRDQGSYGEIYRKTINEAVTPFTGVLENDLKNTNILKKFNLIQESHESEEIVVEASAMYTNNAEQQTLCENLENIVNSITQKNYNLEADSAIVIEKNESSIITSNEVENSMSPFILELNVPNVPKGSKEDYDLLGNINVHVVNEIDDIIITSEYNETIYNSQKNSPGDNYSSIKNEIVENYSKMFKLRDINELLEKRNGSFNENVVKDTITSQTISVPSTEAVEDENNRTMDTISNTHLTLNVTSDSQACNNVPTSQAVFSVPLNETKDTFNSRSDEKNSLNSERSISNSTHNTIPSTTTYSTPATSPSNVLQNTLKMNQNLSENTPQISLSSTSNVNQNNYTYKLASTIFTDLFDNNDSLKSSKNDTNSNENISAVNEQENIFTMDSPPLEALSFLPLPYTINNNDSQITIDKKVKSYKILLLKKIQDILKSMARSETKHKYPHIINSLLHMTTVTEDVWNFQLKVITIIQCVHKLFMFFVNKSRDFRITAIAHALHSTNTQRYFKQLETLLNLYFNLSRNGLISPIAHKMQPLYEELEGLCNEQEIHNINNFMSIDQKNQFNTQVNKYLHICQVNIDQCQQEQPQTSTTNTAADNNKTSLRHFRPARQISSNKETIQNKSAQVLPSMSSPNVPKNLSEKVSNGKKSTNGRPSKDNNIKYNSLCLKCKKESVIICAKCKIAAYCSRACQRDHWEDNHFQVCKSINNTI